MRVAGVIAFLAVVTSALAQKSVPPAPLGESAQDLLGGWELSNAERSKICAATFKNTRVAVGYRVEFDKNCPTQFPVIASVAGWVFPEGDLLRLVDAEGRTLAEFSEVEDGIYEAPTPGVGVMFLQNPAAAARKPDAEPEPERIEEPGAR
jgi:hypothetical protein